MTVRVTTLTAASSGPGGVGGITAYYLGRGNQIDGPGGGPGGGGGVLTERGQLFHEPAVPGLVSYYGATPAQWHGQGAERLGLTGEVASKDFAALLDGGTSDGLRLGRKFNDKSARAFDTTFSVPKDISVLWALADPATRHSIETAFNHSVNAVLDGLEGRALSRASIDGETLPIKTTGLTVAKVFEHTSRAGDPALHCHAIIFSKVECTDGAWRALDAREPKWDQQALSAQFHRALEAELTQTLGIQWDVRTQWAAAPIKGFPDALTEAFSARSKTVDSEIERRLVRFETGMGRAPTERETHRLQREAVLATRPDKHAASQLLERSTATSFHGLWQTQALGTGHTPEDLLDRVLHQTLPQRFTDLDHNTIINTALSEVSGGRSSWRVGELSRELARALPSGIDLSASQVVAWSWDQAEALCQDHCIDLVVDPAPHMRRYTTQTILNQEHQILNFVAAPNNGTPCIIPRNPTEPGDAFVLTLPQHEAAQRLAGTEPTIIIEGPAGAGKTSSLKLGVRELTKQNRHVYGVAPSAQAASVLSRVNQKPGDTKPGIPASSIDKLLFEHNRPDGPRGEWRLPRGTTLIVDEAGMASTPHLAELTRLAYINDWRLALVGDPRQLSAVGRGGMLDHLINTRPELVTTLDTVHRFSATWEQDASLRLRQGDATVLDIYAQHGRLRTSDDPLADAVTAWNEYRHEGSTALMAAHNDTVHELNLLAQQVRLDAGELGTKATPGAGGGVLHVGDTVVTRLNDRQYGVRNRETWTITNINQRGVGLVNADGVATIPARWAAESLELGYAATTHGRQGATLTASITVHPTDHPLDRRGTYVGMTRGSETNLVFTDHPDPITALTDALDNNWIDIPAIAHTEHEQHLLQQHQQQQPEPRSPTAGQSEQLDLDFGSHPLDQPAQASQPVQPGREIQSAEPDTQPRQSLPAPTSAPIDPVTPEPVPLEPLEPVATTPSPLQPVTPEPVTPEPVPVLAGQEFDRAFTEVAKARATAVQQEDVAQGLVQEMSGVMDPWREEHQQLTDAQNRDRKDLKRIDARIKQLDTSTFSWVKNHKEISGLDTRREQLIPQIEHRHTRLKNLGATIRRNEPDEANRRQAWDRLGQQVRGYDAQTQALQTSRVQYLNDAITRPQDPSHSRSSNPGLASVLDRDGLIDLFEERLHLTGLQDAQTAIAHRAGNKVWNAEHELRGHSGKHLGTRHKIGDIDRRLKPLERTPVQQVKNRKVISRLRTERLELVKKAGPQAEIVEKGEATLKGLEATRDQVRAETNRVIGGLDNKIGRIDQTLATDVTARAHNIEATLWTPPEVAATVGIEPTVRNLGSWTKTAAKADQHLTAYPTPGSPNSPALGVARGLSLSSPDLSATSAGPGTGSEVSGFGLSRVLREFARVYQPRDLGLERGIEGPSLGR